MHTQLSTRKSSPSSSEIDDISSSSDKDAVIPEHRGDADYAEGHSDSAFSDSDISESESQRGVVPICPTPVRMIVGVFSMLTGAVGVGMMVYGGIGLNNPDNPELDKHRAMLGVGAAMMIVGFFSAVSTTLYRKGPSAADAT